MKRALAVVWILTLALSGCAARPAWHYALTSETASDEFYADDGTVIATTSYEHPVLRLENAAGEPFSGEARGKTAERLAVCETFNELTTPRTDDIREPALEDYAWRQENDIEFMPLYEEQQIVASRVAGDLLSVQCVTSAYWGGAHPSGGVGTWNFDLAAGEFFTLSDLTDDPTALRGALAEELIAQIRREGLDEGYFEDWETTLRDKAADEYIVYFGAEGITVCFNEYDIAPHAAGLPEFTVDYAVLAPFWNARGERLLAR